MADARPAAQDAVAALAANAHPAAEMRPADGTPRRPTRAERRARLWLFAAATAGYLPGIGVPFRRWLDFAAFDVGGQLAFTSHLLDPVAVILVQASQGLPPTPFVSPPFVALAYVPLALLPYDFAAALHVVVMLAALVAGTILWADVLGVPRRWAILAALAWTPAAASVLSGQIDTLALLLGGLVARSLAAGRPGRAGMWVALLAFKPQVALGTGIGALRRLEPRGFVALAVTGVVLYLLSAVAVGGNLLWPQAWLTTLGAYTAEDFGANGWQASSPVTLGVRASLLVGSWVPIAIGVAVAAVVGWLSLGPGSRDRSDAERLAIWTALGIVVSPHAWIYDATLVLPALGAWAMRASRAGWPTAERWLMVACFAAAALWPAGGVLGLTAVPAVVIAVPVLAARRLGPLGHGAGAGLAPIVRPDSPN